MTIDEMKNRKKELGYSYEKIAELSGVPVSTVRKVLGGITRVPRFSTMQALEDIFKEATVEETWQEKGIYSVKGGSSRVAEPAAAYDMQKKRQGEFTLEDYLALPDEHRVELIDGVIYDMSVPTGYHQLIASSLYSLVREWIIGRKGKCMPFMSPVDVQLDCDNRTIVQPDMLILCDKLKYTPARIIGAPDFVAEALSESTRSKDIFIKTGKYMNAGVREYWVIDFAEIDDYVSPWM